MPEPLVHGLYFLALSAEILISLPYIRQRRRSQIVVDRVTGRERLRMALATAGIVLLPLLHVFTPWLDFARYTLPAWVTWPGLALLAGALTLFWRSHADLGYNWSSSLQIRAGHTLVTHGVYRYLRHPLYASQWLWVLAQPLLLHNWIAGAGGALLFGPLYFARVGVEEQMLLDQFGERYRAYMRRTGRLLPRLGRRL